MRWFERNIGFLAALLLVSAISPTWSFTQEKSVLDDFVSQSVASLFPEVKLAADLGNLLFSGSRSYKDSTLSLLKGTLDTTSADVFGLNLRDVTVLYSKKHQLLMIAGFGACSGLLFKVEFRISLALEPEYRVAFSIQDDTVSFQQLMPQSIGSLIADFGVDSQSLRLQAVVLSDADLVSEIAPSIFDSVHMEHQVQRLLAGDSTSKMVLFPALLGTGDAFGVACRMALICFNGKLAQPVFVAQTLGVWSLAQGFPGLFSAETSTAVMPYIRQFLGDFLWNSSLFVCSAYADEKRSLAKGCQVFASNDFVTDISQDPVLQRFLPDRHAWPLYLKQSGKQGMAARLDFVFDPQELKKTDIHIILETGDVGFFLRFNNKNELGANNLFVDITFNPFSLQAVARCGFAYVGIDNPMRGEFEVHADQERIGFIVSGSGDADYTRTLELLLGPQLVAFLGQKIILRDLAFGLDESWASLLAAAPTAGLSLFALSSLSLAGGIEVGPRINPLQALFKLRGGVDLSSWLFELFYDSKSSWIPLVLFLIDVYWHVITFGQKDVIAAGLLDMNRIQAFLEQLFPVMLDGFYWRLVPRDTRMGGMTLPYGLGGNVRLRSFGQELGVDVLIDQTGARAVAFLDSFDWGILSLFPSKRIGPAVKFFETEYKSLEASGLKLSNWAKSTKEKIALELFADPSGLQIGTNVGIRVADMFEGALAGVVSPYNVDIQGRLTLQAPGMLQRLGVAGDGFILNVSGTTHGLHEPLEVLQGGIDASKIMLEVEFTDAFGAVVQQAIDTAFSSVTSLVEAAVQKLISEVFSQTNVSELQKLREKRDRLCSEKGIFNVVKDPVGCAIAVAQVKALEGKDFALDKLDQLAGLPEAVRNALATVLSMGVRILEHGAVVFDKAAKLFVIERVWWRGTLADFSQGMLSGVTLKGNIFGIPVEFKDLNFDLFAPAKSIFALVSQSISVFRNNLAYLFPFLEEEEFRERLDEVTRQAEEAAERRWQEELAREKEKQQISGEKQPRFDETALFAKSWDEIIGA